MIKTRILLPLTVVAAIGLAACSPKAQTDISEAANSVAADANATGAKAVDDTDAALGAAETRLDNAGAVLGNKADRAADRAGAAISDFGNDIRN